MIRYITVEKEAEAEYVIEKSKFIGHISKAFSKEEAVAYISSIKNQYKDATHNVAAFIIGEKQELMWSSDDGEPQGTSGPPILQMLAKEGLTNIVIVVTRYFGGIKLGTGGLARAYTQTAKLALDAAGKHEAKDLIKEKILIPYSILQKLQFNSEEIGYIINEVIYEDQLTVVVSFAPEIEDTFHSFLRELLQKKEIILEKFEIVY